MAKDTREIEEETENRLVLLSISRGTIYQIIDSSILLFIVVLLLIFWVNKADSISFSFILIGFILVSGLAASWK